jgi:hypothetical protein
MVQTMQDQRMKSGVAGQYFPGISRRRVTIEYALYVFTDTDGVLLINLSI